MVIILLRKILKHCVKFISHPAELLFFCAVYGKTNTELEKKKQNKKLQFSPTTIVNITQLHHIRTGIIACEIRDKTA